MLNLDRIIPPPDAPATGRGLLTFAVTVQQTPDGTPVKSHIQAVVLCDARGIPIDVAALFEITQNISEKLDQLIEIMAR